MRGSPASSRTLRSFAAAATLAVAFLVASPSVAQDDGGPLRFLKPWIEEQLFGRTPAEPPVAPEPESRSPDDRNPQSSQAAAPVDTPDDSAAGATPPAAILDDASGMALRGTTADDPAVTPVEAAETEPQPQPLRFALLAGPSVATTMAAVGPIADDLAAALGRPVELLPLFSYGAMIDALTERRIDGGFFSTAAFALADARCDCLEPLVAPRAADGTLAYHALIVVRSDSGISTLADLEGKTVAVGAADSIGSRRVQLAGLLSEGFDPAQIFGAVLEVDAADKAVRLVAAGAADAAFGWSSLAGDVAGGYTRGTLTDIVASGAVAMDRLAILWRSPAIGHAPFALLRSLPDADKDRIEAYLVGLATANPAAYDALNPYYGGGYTPADPQNYGGFEALMAQNVDAVDLPLAPAETGATVAPPAAEPAPVVSSPSP